MKVEEPFSIKVETTFKTPEKTVFSLDNEKFRFFKTTNGVEDSDIERAKAILFYLLQNDNFWKKQTYYDEYIVSVFEKNGFLKAHITGTIYSECTEGLGSFCFDSEKFWWHDINPNYSPSFL